ncbi:MAG: S-layer homology domain-containing protein [Cyanobacteria bacterium J06623_7]
MLSKNYDRPAIKGIIFTSLISLLSACGNSAAIESLISPDPALEKDTTTPISQTNNTPAESQAASLTPDNEPKTDETVDSPPQPQRNDKQSATPQATDKQEPPAPSSVSDLLLNFPQTFPVYPQAELQEIKSGENENSGMLIWQTQDSPQAVADYYQAELTAKEWDIIKPFSFNPQQKVTRAIAVKEDLRVELSLFDLQGQKPANNNQQGTKLAVVYHPLGEDIPQSSISRWQNAVADQKPADQKPEVKQSTTPDQKPDSDRSQVASKVQQEPDSRPKIEANTPPVVRSDNNTYTAVDTDFADLDEVPLQLQQPLESVAALSILTPYTAKGNVEVTKFAPNETITRGEYARWLIAANNRYYADDPGKKIYLVTKTSQPAFNDVKSKHPDFAAIQSLAEAGLIPSRLTEDSTNLLFRPGAPLTREDLISWKVPLDTRKSLPQASIKAVEESWGFQDAANIDSAAIRALYADYQNGDRANVRRMFGYTTLFQPKKSVTRAEAASSLWYFGFQGDGVTAKEILESEAAVDS